MSMQELTDDQLDGLFRKSAEEFDVPYDPAAWEAVQNQLNDRDNHVFWRQFLRWAIPVVLMILLTGGGWYAYRNVLPGRGPANTRLGVLTRGAPAAPISNPLKPANHPTRSTPAAVDALPLSPDLQLAPAATTERPGRSADPPVAKVQPVLAVDHTDQPLSVSGLVERRRGNVHESRNEMARPQPGLTAPLSGNPERLALSDKNSATAAVTIRKTRSVSKRNKTEWRVVAVTGAALVKGDSASRNKQIHETTLQTSFRNKPLAYRKSLTEPGPPVGSPGISTDAVAEERMPLPNLTELASLPGQWPLPLGYVDREVIVPETTEPVSKPQPARLTGLSLRLLVSPDLTAIGLHNFVRPGTNIGLLVEYQLTPRWSVQAGIMRSIKVYEASPDAYGKSVIGTWAVQPLSVYGRCNMLDIPINLRYDLAVRPRRVGGLANRWFVSGGVTTYVMLQEDYTYTYTNPADPRIRYRQWSTHTGQYEFSQLNLSVGYERSLSRRLSWQAEPFLKIPLKGVGYYKLDLLSTGAFFSLRYKL